jgi:hypothetical protein
MTTGQPADKPLHAWLYPFIVAAGTLIAFGNITLNEFVVLDDPQNIWQNPRFNPPTLDGVLHYWTHAEYGLYIPFTYTAWGLLAAIARVAPDPLGVALNPAIFHAASVGCHVIGALLLYAILLRLISQPRAACMGALLFALHPVQVEPVAWAAGLKDVLAGMFALAAIWQYVKFAQNPARRQHYFLATFAFIAAMLSKPSALVTPMIVFVIDLWLIRGAWKPIVTTLAPWFVVSAICAVVGRIVQPAIGVAGAPIWARPLVAGDALTFYLWKLIWPIDLAVDYGRRPDAVMQNGLFYAAWIIPAAIALAVTRNRKRNPELLVAGAVFVIGVLPVLGFVTFLYQYFSTTADHYLYLAMLGPALATAWLVRRCGETRSTLITVVFVLGLFDWRTVHQTFIWRDDFALFGNATVVNPRSVLGWNNLGSAFNDRHDLDQARECFSKAVELDPSYSEAHENLAAVLDQQGDLAGAIQHNRKALEIYRARPPELRTDVSRLEELLESELRRAEAANAPTTR